MLTESSFFVVDVGCEQKVVSETEAGGTEPMAIDA
jgi:hypothetical protein